MLTTDRLRGILDLGEESRAEPTMTGDDLAARAYLSRFHFDRIVSAALGEPPGAFRRRLLLERAAHRLVATADAVIDVAYDAGYGSPEAFARAFTRAYGAAPSEYRLRPSAGPILPAPSGVHFHPPGGLRVPAQTRSDVMDVLTRMVDHHLETTRAILDRAAAVDPAVLDELITLSVEGIDEEPTLRRLADRLVTQLEMWVGAVSGATTMPSGDTTPDGLRSRLDAVVPRFRDAVVGPVQQGRADDTFVDAICDPPETFTYGGVLAHVLTFAAVRRTMAIGALERAGVTDLGAGDPMGFVGSGPDAGTVTRRRE